MLHKYRFSVPNSTNTSPPRNGPDSGENFTEPEFQATPTPVVFYIQSVQ